MEALGQRRKAVYLAWVAALIGAAVGVGCAKADRSLPGDTDPKRPWGAASVAAAPAAPAPPSAGIIDDKLFPVELVMQHQNELGIEAAQKEAILKELERAQVEYNRLEWDLHGEKEKLSLLLGSERVDEAAALEGARKVTEAEGKLKVAHLRLLVRVKNQLTASQQAKLNALRAARRPSSPQTPR